MFRLHIFHVSCLSVPSGVCHFKESLDNMFVVGVDVSKLLHEFSKIVEIHSFGGGIRNLLEMLWKSNDMSAAS